MTVATTVPLLHTRALWRPEQFNRVNNPGFETNTTGWSVAGGGVIAAATSITRITTDFHTGSACGSLVTTATNGSGVKFAFGTDTWYAEATYGTVYVALVWLKRVSGSYRARVYLGSLASRDYGELDVAISNQWQPYRVVWMPSANYTDAVVCIQNGSPAITTILIDDVSVYQLDAFSQCENGNFLADTTGWDTGAGNIAGAATSLTRITTDGMDPANQTCAQLVTTSTSGSGADFPLGGRKFTNGRTYRLLCALKSVSGSTTARLRLGSIGTGADRGDTTTTTITASWALYSVDWTPSADRTDACLAISNGAASVMTANLGMVEVYEASDQLGSDVEAMTYTRGGNFDGSASSIGGIDLTVVDIYSASAATSHKYTPWNSAGPLYGSLEPGRRVWVRATYSGSIYGLAFGTIRKMVPDPLTGTVAIHAEDPFFDMEQATIARPFENNLTYYDARIQVFGVSYTWANGFSGTNAFSARRCRPTSDSPEREYFFDGTDGPGSMLGYLDQINEATGSAHYVHPHAMAEVLWEYRTVARTALSDASRAVDETVNDDFARLDGLEATDEGLENSQTVPWQGYELINRPDHGGSVGEVARAVSLTSAYATADAVDDPFLHFLSPTFGSTDDTVQPIFEVLGYRHHERWKRGKRGKRKQVRWRTARRLQTGGFGFVPFSMNVDETRVITVDYAVPVQGMDVVVNDGFDPEVIVLQVPSPRQLIVTLVAAAADVVDAVRFYGQPWSASDAVDEPVVDQAALLDKGQRSGPSFSTPYINTQGQALGIGSYRNWRYGSARLRPTLHLQNRFPSIGARDVSDHVSLTGARFSLSSAKFLVTGLTVEVMQGGLEWWQHLTLEAMPTAQSWFIPDDATLGLPDGTHYAFP